MLQDVEAAEKLKEEVKIK